MASRTDGNPGHPALLRTAAHAANRGTAWGAVSILNATATGIGCALAVEAATHASWTPPDEESELPVAASALVSAAAEELRALGGWDATLVARVACPFPPQRGLKTSSSVAAALLRAGRQALGQPPDDDWTLRASLSASRRAKVTLTGALDDQVATLRGGAHLTDNAQGTVLLRLPAKAWHVAVWVPQAAIAKATVAALDPTSVAPQMRQATKLARAGDLPGALTANGRAYHSLYAAAGLPVDERPVQAALAHGAIGAGLSGTGPAVAALFDAPRELPAVAGGTWTWTRAVP